MKLKYNYFCPNCRHPIFVPPFLRTARIHGTVNLKCANVRCGRGVVSLKFELPFDFTEALVQHVMEEAALGG